MWNTICTSGRVSVSKSFFGLCTSVTYCPTNSIIDSNNYEYTPADGERLKQLLNTPRERMAERLQDFHIQKTVNGNYMAEVCASRDDAFFAIQLFQFQKLNYEPVTEPLILEGEEAAAMSKLFR